MQQQIVIIDFGMGNLNSVKKKLARLNINAIITSDVKIIELADKIILPGVGHFAVAMTKLLALNLIGVLNHEVLIKKKPVLGICLGMQLMAKHSEEGNSAGLGWFDANVIKFKIKDAYKHKIPHTGWNQIEIAKASPLMLNIPNLSEFYFVHAYHFITSNQSDILNYSDYEYKFVSGVEKENIFGVQYHPEKSHDLGEQILKNFIQI
jgi:glutamine amidotransferase